MSFEQLLHIDRTKSQALYRQIAEQFCVLISEGRLPAGTQLPTVRRLAELLSVTRVTAQNAYSELQTGGWIESVVGRGTFVIGAPQKRDLIRAVSGQITADSVMYNMQRIGQIAGMRSFAYAEPDPTLFPDDFWASVSAQAESFTSLMQYGPVQGDEALRVELSALLSEIGIAALPDDLLITTGVSGGLAILAQCLGEPGATVAVEQPVYLGLLNTLHTFGLQPIGIPRDEHGFDLAALEHVLQTHRPRFLYVSTRFQNPTGWNLPEAHQKALLALAQRYDLLIVEDDTYGQLGLETDRWPSPLKAGDQDGRVVYLNGFSKSLLPGLRTGYLVAPPNLRQQLITVRQSFDLTGPLFLQRALALFLHRGRFKSHLRRVLPYYRERRDALLHALSVEMPPGVTWTEPPGGLCCWVTIPRPLYPENLYYEAIEQGVAFTPGDVFLIEPGDDAHLRLCFARLSPEAIHDGISILARLLRSAQPMRQFRQLHTPRPLV